MPRDIEEKNHVRGNHVRNQGYRAEHIRFFRGSDLPRRYLTPGFGGTGSSLDSFRARMIFSA